MEELVEINDAFCCLFGVNCITEAEIICKYFQKQKGCKANIHPNSWRKRKPEQTPKALLPLFKQDFRELFKKMIPQEKKMIKLN